MTAIPILIYTIVYRVFFLSRPEQFADGLGNTVTIVANFSREGDCYTQGLHWIGNNTLIESCGNYGHSRIRLIRLLDTDSKHPKSSGSIQVLKQTVNSKSEFAEGCDIIEHEDGNSLVYQLTWNEKVVNVYDL